MLTRSLFPEPPVDKLFERVEGRGGVFALRDYFQQGAGGRGEHHHLHDRFSVNNLIPFPHFDAGLVLIRHVDELHRGAGVKAKFILNGDLTVHVDSIVTGNGEPHSRGSLNSHHSADGSRLVRLIDQIHDLLPGVGLAQEAAECVFLQAAEYFFHRLKVAVRIVLG